MGIESEFRKLAWDYRRMATHAVGATAINLVLLAKDYEDHADMLKSDRRSN